MEISTAAVMILCILYIIDLGLLTKYPLRWWLPEPWKISSLRVGRLLLTLQHSVNDRILASSKRMMYCGLDSWKIKDK